MVSPGWRPVGYADEMTDNPGLMLIRGRTLAILRESSGSVEYTCEHEAWKPGHYVLSHPHYPLAQYTAKMEGGYPVAARKRLNRKIECVLSIEEIFKNFS